MKPPLLPRVAAGDPQAIEACLDRYGALVWSIARRYCPTQADAEDAVQEAFFEIWRVAKRFDPAIAAEPTFITMIARRRVIDFTRRVNCRNAARIEELQEVVDPAAEGSCSMIDNADEVQRIRVAMQQLRPAERQVLELSINEGLSQSEIASTTGWPLGTVKSHARRGLARLRELSGVGATGNRAESPAQKGGLG